jgi:hypothetical protein
MTWYLVKHGEKFIKVVSTQIHGLFSSLCRPLSGLISVETIFLQ